MLDREHFPVRNDAGTCRRVHGALASLAALLAFALVPAGWCGAAGVAEGEDAGGMDALVLHVDPSRLDEGTGTVESPARTLEHALKMIGNAGDVTVRLEDGTYGDWAESFPLLLPVSLRRLRIEGPAAGAARFEVRERRAIDYLRVRPAPGTSGGDPAGGMPAAGVALTIELARLSFSEGNNAISVLGIPGRRLDVVVSDCTFAGQKIHAVQIVAGEGGEVTSSVRGCEFSGGALSFVDLGTRIGSRHEFDVTGNRIEGTAAMPLLFRSAVSVFAADGAVARGDIASNAIRDAGDGIVVSTSERLDGGSTVDVDIVSNLVVGSPVSPDEAAGEESELLPLLRDGVHLSIHGAAELHVRALFNTLAGGSGSGLFVDESLGRFGEDLCAFGSVEVAGNVIGDFAGGDISRPRSFTGEEPALPPCFLVWGNAFGGLDELGLTGRDGNTAWKGEEFADPSRRDYRLRAGSRLIDVAALDPLSPVLDDLPWDAAGGCRLADGDGDQRFLPDAGALEYRGDGALCVRDLAPFVRGDCNADEGVDISDAIAVFGYLFLGSAAPSCLDACDANDDGDTNISDGIAVLNYLFADGPPLPAPFPAPGIDPTPDAFRCTVR